MKGLLRFSRAFERNAISTSEIPHLTKRDLIDVTISSSLSLSSSHDKYFFLKMGINDIYHPIILDVLISLPTPPLPAEPPEDFLPIPRGRSIDRVARRLQAQSIGDCGSDPGRSPSRIAFDFSLRPSSRPPVRSFARSASLCANSPSRKRSPAVYSRHSTHSSSRLSSTSTLSNSSSEEELVPVDFTLPSSHSFHHSIKAKETASVSGDSIQIKFKYEEREIESFTFYPGSSLEDVKDAIRVQVGYFTS